MNGRELTADDVVFNWHRMMGMGEFAEAGGSPHQGQITMLSPVIRSRLTSRPKTVSSYDFDALEAIRGYHSSSVGKSGTGASTTGLQDPQFDALFDAAQAADNVEEQQRVVREIDLYLARIHALVWSPTPPQFNVNQSLGQGLQR